MTVRRKRGRQPLLLLLNTSLFSSAVDAERGRTTAALPRGHDTDDQIPRRPRTARRRRRRRPRPSDRSATVSLLPRPRHRLITATPSHLHRAHAAGHDTISYLRSPQSPGTRSPPRHPECVILTFFGPFIV